MKKILISTASILIALTVFSPLSLFAKPTTVETATVNLFLVTQNDNDKSIGTVSFTNTEHGLLIVTHLKNLSPGYHGFHIHENPDCGNNGQNAGGHFDPNGTGKHEGPFSSNGHAGDLPVLWVANNREANNVLIAPNLTLNDIDNRSIMIHADGDNYSDQPKKLGGGGARVACGVITAD